LFPPEIRGHYTEQRGIAAYTTLPEVLRIVEVVIVVHSKSATQYQSESDTFANAVRKVESKLLHLDFILLVVSAALLTLLQGAPVLAFRGIRI
jgi:hypothetical protein